MIGCFVPLSPEELSGLVADPSNVYDFLYPDGDERDGTVDVDKAWHGVHFLLTGEAWGGEPPLADAVLGGTEIGDDNGYGPARYLTAEEVRAVAAVLADLPPAAFRARFDAAELVRHEIYPDIWKELDDAVGYVAAGYETIRDFYADAAGRGSAALIYLS